MSVIHAKFQTGYEYIYYGSFINLEILSRINNVWELKHSFIKEAKEINLSNPQHVLFETVYSYNKGIIPIDII